MHREFTHIRITIKSLEFEWVGPTFLESLILRSWRDYLGKLFFRHVISTTSSRRELLPFAKVRPLARHYWAPLALIITI